MKKKVLALVVLAAMLVSILPMAAFAAGGATQYGAIVNEETTTGTAGDDDAYVEFDVFVRSVDGEAFGEDQKLYIASSRTVDTIVAQAGEDDEKTGSADGVLTFELPSAESSKWVNVRVSSDIAGSGKIAFGLKDADGKTQSDYENGGLVQAYAQGKDISAADAMILTEKAYSYTFSTSTANKVVLTAAGEAVYANGSSYHEVEAYVTSNGIPASGVEVTFSITKGTGASLSATKATTDSKGKATVKLFGTKSAIGDDAITVQAKIGDGKEDKKVTANYEFTTTGIVDIKAVSDNNQKIAKGSDFSAKFNFFDAKGNKIKGDDTLGAENNLKGAEVIVTAKPSNAAVKEKIHKETKGADADSTSTYFWDGEKLTIASEWINKEGAYTIKFSLANGKSASYDFTVKEQGDVVSMSLSYDSDAYAMNFEGNPEPSVKLLDAEGYSTKAADEGDTLQFTVSNPSIVEIDKNDGALTSIEDKSGTVVVTVVNETKSLVASTTIEIQKAASTLKITAPAATTVGEEAKLNVQLVDVDGKTVSNGVAATGINAYASVKPADSVFSVGATSYGDFADDGTASVGVVGNVAGTYKVQVVVSTDAKAYTGSVDVVFGEASAIVGNDIIFMIGASSYVVDGKPVASTSIPFIENGRTYLGIRDMGMAMGIVGDANIVWDQAAQTAKLVKDGITVEVTVGATAIKVTKDNVTTEVAIDAPAQNKDGRVYLPFRAVFEAFGYSVEYANGTITCGK